MMILVPGANERIWFRKSGTNEILSWAMGKWFDAPSWVVKILKDANRTFKTKEG